MKNFSGSGINRINKALGNAILSSAAKLYVNCLVSSSGNGLTPQCPFKTIQEAVSTANTVRNKGKSFDIIIAAGYYAEKVNFSDIQNHVWSENVSLMRSIASAGRIRLIADGPVVVNNGAEATGATFAALRPAVELIGLTIYSKTVTQPAVLVRCEKTTGFGGEYSNGFGAGFKMIGCHLKDVGVGDAVNAGSTGLRIEGALYPEFEDCIFEGFETGIYQSGSGTGYCIRPVYKNCRFEGNTNDISSGGTQFARLQACIWADDGSTKHLTAISGGVPADVDCLISGGFINAANLAKLDSAGWKVAGVCLATASTILGDTDLTQ